MKQAGNHLLTITLSSQSELSVSPPATLNWIRWMDGRKEGRKEERMNGWMLHKSGI